MGNLVRLQDRLEILLITYNRGDHLLNTLEMLEPSPFRECRVTVVDNCSSDDTELVVARVHDLFPNLQYLRNRVNIGGNPNYLKAIELSSSEYTWILCDDDLLDFSNCGDVIDAIDSGTFDLIEVGATERGTWPRGVATTVQELLKQKLDYHFRMSFFPAYVFRTVLFDSECFCWGYKNVDRLYPQFEFLNKSIRDNFTIYIAKNRIVTRNEVNEHSFSPLAWYLAWVECCKEILDPSLRTRTIEDATVDRGFLKSLCFWSILDKNINENGDFLFRVIRILRVLFWRQKLKYLLVLPFAFLPLPLTFWVWVRILLYKLMKVSPEDVPPLTFVDRG